MDLLKIESLVQHKIVLYTFSILLCFLILSWDVRKNRWRVGFVEKGSYYTIHITIGAWNLRIGAILVSGKPIGGSNRRNFERMGGIGVFIGMFGFFGHRLNTTGKIAWPKVWVMRSLLCGSYNMVLLTKLYRAWKVSGILRTVYLSVGLPIQYTSNTQK